MDNGIARVKSVFVVVSGKGGVGKSTISCQLAIELSKSFRVGILDVDLCGPSVPRILGLNEVKVQQCSAGWLPVVANPVTLKRKGKLVVMSIGFLLPEKDSAVVWRGPKKTSMISQLLSDVVWGDLDALIVDTPPGTSDEHLAVLEHIREQAQERLVGAIVITTPQRVSLCDVNRQLTFCEKVQLPVVGIIENMSGVRCPACSESVNLFASGGGEALAAKRGISFLGRIAFDPEVAKMADAGCAFEEKLKLSQTVFSFLPRLISLIPNSEN